MQRYTPTLKPEEDELTRNIVCLASEYGRYGYRRVTTMLNKNGLVDSKARVQRRAFVRHWSEGKGERRREGLKVPQKQPNRSRLSAAATRH